MSDQRFLQSGFEKQLAHLVEECGEVLAAAGKTQRWGPHSVNPLLPPAQQETNLRWLHREMADVREAIVRLEATMEEEFGWPPEGKTHPPSDQQGREQVIGELCKSADMALTDYVYLAGKWGHAFDDLERDNIANLRAALAKARSAAQ